MPLSFQTPEFWILVLVITAIISYDVWAISKCRVRIGGILALCFAFIPFPLGFHLGALAAGQALSSEPTPEEFAPYIHLAQTMTKFGGFGTVGSLILAIIATIEIRNRNSS